MPFSTMDIIDKAVSLNPNFKDGDEKKRIYWVYDSLKRRNLTVRTRTHHSQIKSAAMQSVKQSYSRNIMTTFRNRIADPK